MKASNVDLIVKNLEELISKILDHRAPISKDGLDKFMKDVGEPLGLDVTGEDYDWVYEMRPASDTSCPCFM
jgi:hypothetical protein